MSGPRRGAETEARKDCCTWVPPDPSDKDDLGHWRDCPAHAETRAVVYAYKDVLADLVWPPYERLRTAGKAAMAVAGINGGLLWEDADKVRLFFGALEVL